MAQDTHPCMISWLKADEEEDAALVLSKKEHMNLWFAKILSFTRFDLKGICNSSLPSSTSPTFFAEKLDSSWHIEWWFV